MDVVIATWLLVLAGIDLRERRLPNPLTVPPVLGGVASSVALGHPGVALAMAAAVAPYLLAFGIGGCGGGDVKFAAGLGAILVDPWLSVGVVALAAALSLVGIMALSVRGVGGFRGRSVPHGPALAVATFVVGGLGP